ncbi:MAG: hypothetical protein BWY71_01358 [Planctomycetes bacterium ADurb.Bin412]|nr:MAG: hypothetical protein BWY71_01358 [Planctomycetes bacterium ADurb.Bin412]
MADPGLLLRQVVCLIRLIIGLQVALADRHLIRQFLFQQLLGQQPTIGIPQEFLHLRIGIDLPGQGLAVECFLGQHSLQELHLVLRIVDL